MRHLDILSFMTVAFQLGLQQILLASSWRNKYVKNRKVTSYSIAKCNLHHMLTNKSPSKIKYFRSSKGHWSWQRKQTIGIYKMPRPRPLLVLQSQGPKLRMMRQRVVVGRFSLSPQKNDGFPCAACCSSAALGSQSLQITHVPHCKCKKMQLLNGKTDENRAKHGKQLPSWQHHNINHHRKKKQLFPRIRVWLLQPSPAFDPTRLFSNPS